MAFEPQQLPWAHSGPEIARHEASHCVAGLAFGWRVRVVFVIEQPDGSDWAGETIFDRQSIVGAPRSVGIVQLAGSVASRRCKALSGYGLVPVHRRGDERDLFLARQAAAEFLARPVDDPETRSLLRLWECEAAALLGRYAPEIALVATALHRRRVLRGSDLARLVPALLDGAAERGVSNVCQS
jgi:hypothetical protein